MKKVYNVLSVTISGQIQKDAVVRESVRAEYSQHDMHREDMIMKSSKMWNAALLAALLAAGSLAGCSQLENKPDSEIVLAKFGKEAITMDYARVLLNEAQYEYEELFTSIYGIENFWNEDLYGNGSTMQANVINSTLAGIRQTKVLNDYAKKNGITLTEEQKALLEDAIGAAFDGKEEYNQTIGLTEDMARTIYTENAVANAVYLNLIEDVDRTVGEDEFIRKDISYVKITPSDLEEATEPAAADAETESAAEETAPASAEESAGTETEADAVVTEAEAETDAEPVSEGETALSGEQQAQADAIEAAAADIRERLDAGEEPADLVSAYNEDTRYFTVTQSSTTISDTSSYVYTELAFSLSTGETAVYEDEESGSWYVLKCTNDNDEQARESAIHSEIHSREAQLFSEKYADIEAASPKFTVDEDVLAKISFANPLYVKPEETTEAPEIVTEEESGEEQECAPEQESAAEEESTAEPEEAQETETETVSAAEEESTSES